MAGIYAANGALNIAVVDGSTASGLYAPSGAYNAVIAGVNVVTPQMFEAVVDGVTDDTLAIKAAITAAGEGGIVYFPKGIYLFSDEDVDDIGLTQLSGQRWIGDGYSSILRLSPATTAINAAIFTEDFAEDWSIENLQIDGNRANIEPATDLYNTFYLVWGPRGGQRGLYRNLLLSNSWGRVLQTSQESETEYAEDILVENVRVTNAGTKAISATKSKRVTISNCFTEVDPYATADHAGGVGDGNATSGSCFETNDAHDVIIKGNHGVQVGATIEAPGIRLINGSSSIKAFGNTIDGASYLGFLQCDDIDFYGNTGRDIRGNAILIADNDTEEPTRTAKRIRVHHNTIIDPDDAYVLITANKDSEDAFVETYIYENDFVQSAGTPTQGIFNNGVIAPATGGECLVYAWGNRFTGTIPNHYGGDKPYEIQPEPDRGWQIVDQSSVAIIAPADTVENTLATITIPANRMGKNGRLRITAHWSNTNTADDKIFRIRFGGSQATASINTTNLQVRTNVEISNRNALNSQIVSIPGLSTAWGPSASAVLPLTINTAANANITITGQKETAGDTLTLESYVVEMFYEI